MCDSQNKTSNVVSFTVGSLLGAGAGFFLATKKGRSYMKKAWKLLEPYIDEAKDDVDDVAARGRDTVEDALKSVKDFADENIPPKVKTSIRKTFFKGV